MNKNSSATLSNPSTDYLNVPKASRKKSVTGSLALYTWGFLATASVIFAGMFVVTEVRINNTWEMVNAEIGRNNEIAFVPTVRRLHDRNRFDIQNKSSQTFDVASLVPAPAIDFRTTASVDKTQNRIKFDGFGVNIGTTANPDSLADRYLAVSNNAPELFFGITPKFSKAVNNLDTGTKLIVGPFLSEKESAKFCKSLNARMALDCSLEAFVGTDLELPKV